MSKAIEYKSGGIRCDNPDCDFKDETARLEDMKSWLNRPCPKCGENLLTKADYDSLKSLVSVKD